MSPFTVNLLYSLCMHHFEEIPSTDFFFHQKLVTENQQLAEFIGNPTLNKMQKEGEKINDFIAVYLILNLLCALLLMCLKNNYSCWAVHY